MDRHKRTADIDSVFWQQWQEHQYYLYRCCVKWMGGNPTQAEDALSMAMLKAREKIGQCVKAIENFKAWFAQLTYNLCMDLLKKSKHHFQDAEDVELIVPSADIVTQGENPFLVTMQQELEKFFCLAIDDLPKRLRETFVLYFKKQYSYQEIATELNISYPNVRKRISQARAILRDKYQEYKKEGEIPVVESGKAENFPSQESVTEIVAVEISQEGVFSEEKSESISVEANVEEELPEIETVGNGEKQLVALSVLVKLLRETKQKPKSHFSDRLSVNSYQLSKGFRQALKLAK
ncbi:MAG: sigma-70 family RNA polymerase sigma factor [Okeania sp. SIO2D1]|nr:sigma-70 family RNA polymerase sigma factor [Okeania sp. SIO2D1]